MNIESLPLLKLFTRLREADLPLGIDDYQLLLRSLQAGFGLSDRTALKSLCRMLWVKTDDDGRLFDYHFEQLIPQQPESETSSQPQEPLSGQVETSLGASSFAPARGRDKPGTSPTKVSELIETSEMTIKAEDEIQVAQAVFQATSINDEISSKHILRQGDYFPVTRRQMKQSWRHLRRPKREGPPVELDVEATVHAVGSQAMLLKPVLVPRRINRTEFLLLIDHEGSMVPFHMLSHRLVETALRGGRLEKASIYYFHNCPVEYLYRDRAHQYYERIDDILNRPSSQRTGVLVFSDAGAARGGFRRDRIDLTKKLLDRFRHRFRYIAWLNPMPRSRWSGTTAGEIMKIIPMFDLSRRGLDEAIDVLRGRPINFIDTFGHEADE